MPQSALDQVSSLNSLKTAFKYILRKSTLRSRNTKGFDGQSINQYSAKLDQNLKNLSKIIRSDDGYKYSPLRPALLPKPDGSHRVICVPTVSDRIVQRAVLDFLAEGDKCGLLNSVSFGFVQDGGVKKAAQKARSIRNKKKWAYKTDINKFFDNVSRLILKSHIRKKVRYRSLHALLLAAVDCEVEESNIERTKKIKYAGITKGKGVRQGMPISPFFANLFLGDFDRCIQSKGLSMIRYADDLIIFCETGEDCLNAHKICRDELSRIHLSIPEPGPNSKTKIYKPTDVAEFLGVGVVPMGNTYSINILKVQTDKIRQKIDSLSDFNTLIDDGITIAKLGQKLEGLVAGYLEAYSYCDNLSQFGSALDVACDNSLRKIYVDGLGMDLKILSSEKKAFLGLK
jgi:RNA-directed DNA polymerase